MTQRFSLGLWSGPGSSAARADAFTGSECEEKRRLASVGM